MNDGAHLLIRDFLSESFEIRRTVTLDTNAGSIVEILAPTLFPDKKVGRVRALALLAANSK
jgi:hypothetical protein